ncbi:MULTISPECIES: 3-(3-hydroxy-phenyl)propionate transporter MhpT [unclassified Acinetobacter]|uniref:3-(3-hydroxy-phenyl)propionate transporter MhpT n=1 Tax=unclassified Acinetobacter TaxID=196816 RepID=UPI0019099662|nr:MULTISPECIES: 3-(3-hydroxy-phenyl)propionate transporter MhpT [unclassified Acinetobacter]MBK0062824.1 3-(3-hydroxy-phenyl)propionate transporter MhpT [Acinetobacter sp. S55]MBK0065599.1 3-(3-hydroxy-phenyl)propionate transporter MhpT [Acinetobacter sp. S54]
MNMAISEIETKKKLNITILLCFFIAVIEGMDIQAVGVVATSLKEVFGLDKSQLGLVFSAGILGLLPGAVLGGYYADKIGRKKVLILSVLLFSLFTICMVLVQSYYSLLLVRFLAGLGFGAALPNLITLASESVIPKNRGKAVGLMYCGMPIGAALVALWVAYDFSENWKTIFYIGGIVPLLLIPVLVKFLPESKDFMGVKTEKLEHTTMLNALFRKNMRYKTILFWVGNFFTTMVQYIMLSWLPSLFVELGFSKQEGSKAQLFFLIGATIGTILLSYLIDRWNKSFVILMMYAGILTGLFLLSISIQLKMMYMAAAFTGIFMIGGIGVMYAFGSFVYPTESRGQGVGAASSIGRLGAIVGPMIVGQLLFLGSGTSMIFLAAIPCIVSAAICMFILSKKLQRV